MSTLGTSPLLLKQVVRNPGRLRALVGIALLAVAALCFCLRLTTASHDRAWSADASPRASYDLLASRQYTLSSVAGPTQSTAAPLSCTIRSEGPPGSAPGAAQPLALTMLPGDRVTHGIATFIAPFSGSAHIACARGPAVFVDDAEGLGRDSNAELVLIGIGLGVVGLLLASSAVVVRRYDIPPEPGSVAAGTPTSTRVGTAPGE